MATSLTLGSAARACAAAPVPRSPQPTRPTFSRSPPAACAFGKAESAPATAADLISSRRVVMGRMAGLLLRQGVQLEPADEQLEAFRLQQDLTRRGGGVVTRVD